VGGTFTDVIVLDGDRLRVRKVPTSSPQHHAVAEGVEALDVPVDAPVAHGTTTATNALLERRGARTALITTDGFRDVLVIGRQNRPDLYDFSPARPEPLVPRDLRHELTERVGADGEVVVPLDDVTAHYLVDTLRGQGVESIAVATLFSYRNPEHESRIAEILRKRLPEVPVTASHEILPEYREYERTATTVVNAYVRPTVERYFTHLAEALDRRPVRVMQSNGGTIGLGTAAEQAARLALSGPAGGVVGALGVARRAFENGSGQESAESPEDTSGDSSSDREPRLLTLDMGGTSTDVALCDGDVPRTTEHEIAGLPLRLPSTDIHTVGAGGGSIAHVDEGGGLRVGPESAGAEPGPACYGRGGTEPTVTDAHLVLGRLHPDYILGGEGVLDVDPDAADAAVGRLADSLGMSTEEAALGMLRIANATMERALRRVSVERGHDPRNYVLVPFGGAGPLHAAGLADALGTDTVLVPPAPGVLSALGLLMADVVYDTARALLHPTADLVDDPSPLQEAVRTGTDEVERVLADHAERHGTTRVETEIDLRYRGQSYELSVPLPTPITPGAVESAVEAFHEAHRRRYGHANPAEPVEVVAVRLRGVVATDPPRLPTEPPTDAPLDDAVLHRRPVWFGPDGPTDTVAYDRDRLHHGHAFDGPAIVHQYDTTIVIPPGWHATVDATGCLELASLAR
jgi:N-methylhydantoinase A